MLKSLNALEFNILLYEGRSSSHYKYHPKQQPWLIYPNALPFLSLTINVNMTASNPHNDSRGF